jgi:hypothetical protein
MEMDDDAESEGHSSVHNQDEDDEMMSAIRTLLQNKKQKGNPLVMALMEMAKQAGTS